MLGNFVAASLVVVLVVIFGLSQCGPVPTPERIPVPVLVTAMPDQPGLESGEIQRIVDFTHKNVCYIHRATGHIDCLPLREE